MWFALLELIWRGDSSCLGNAPGSNGSGSGNASATTGNPRSSTREAGIDPAGIKNGRIIRLARRAAVSVLRSGPWSPAKNRELVVMQVRP